MSHSEARNAPVAFVALHLAYAPAGDSPDGAVGLPVLYYDYQNAVLEINRHFSEAESF